MDDERMGELKRVQEFVARERRNHQYELHFSLPNTVAELENEIVRLDEMIVRGKREGFLAAVLEFKQVREAARKKLMGLRQETFGGSCSADEALLAHAVIRWARELVRTSWCKDVPARDARNNPVTALARDAVKWSAAGALHRAASVLGDRKAGRLHSLALIVVQDCIGAMDVAEFNDSQVTRRDDVVHVFDVAARKMLQESRKEGKE